MSHYVSPLTTAASVVMSLMMAVIGLSALMTNAPVTGIICLIGAVCWGIIASDWSTS